MTKSKAEQELKDLLVMNMYFAVELIKQGHELKSVRPSKKDPTRSVFFFKNTSAAREAHGRLCFKIDKTNKK